MTVWGLDLGNKQTKLYSDKCGSKKGAIVLPSTIAYKKMVDGRFAFGDPTDVDTYQSSRADNKFYWGRGVFNFQREALADTLGFTGRYDQDNFKNIAEFSLGRLAKDYPEFSDKVQPVTVAVGLPSGDFNEVNIKKMIKQFMGQHLTNVNDQAYTVKVEHVYVIPQSIGTLYALMVDDKGKVIDADLAQKRVAVIDDGGGTLLADQFINFRFDEMHRAQLETGVNLLYKQISKAIDQEFTINSDLHVIEQALRDGEHSHKFQYKQSDNNIFDITDLVERSIDFYTKTLCESVYNTFDNLADIDVLIFTGGGASIINHNIVENFFAQTEVKFVPNPEIANVKGFYRYGIVQEQRVKVDDNHEQKD